MDTNEQTKYFVDENETVYTTYQQEIQGNGIEKDLSFELIVTDKNIYANSFYDNEEQENIIDLQSVEFVNYTHTKVKQNHNGFFTFSFLLLIGGLIMGCLFIPQANDNSGLLITGFVMAIVGLILTIIALVISRPKHICKLIIGTSGEPIELIANDIDPDEIKKLQKDIFKAKSNI